MRRLALAALLLVATACSAGQDPGLAPTTDKGPTTTSQMLAPCPPGGPDPTTPAAGCLNEDGTVVSPGSEP